MNISGGARAVTDAGIEIVARISCEVKPNPNPEPYLRAKKEKMVHALCLLIGDDAGQSKDFGAGKAHQNSARVEFANIPI
jgi:hypothetical protein